MALVLLLSTSLAVPVPNAAASLDGGHEAKVNEVTMTPLTPAATLTCAALYASQANRENVRIDKDYWQSKVNTLTEGHSGRALCKAGSITNPKGTSFAKAMYKGYDFPATKAEVAYAVKHWGDDQYFEDLADKEGDNYKALIIAGEADEDNGGHYQYEYGDDDYMWFKTDDYYGASVMIFMRCKTTERVGAPSVVVVGYHDYKERSGNCFGAVDTLIEQLKDDGICVDSYASTTRRHLRRKLQR